MADEDNSVLDTDTPVVRSAKLSNTRSESSLAEINRKKLKGVSSKIYCRKCMRFKYKKDFYDATDTFLDCNGKMSICGECINDIFTGFLISENDDYHKAVLKTCKTVNVYFLSEAVDATLADKETKKKKKPGAPEEHFFGRYKAKLINMKSLRKDYTPHTFSETNRVLPSDIINQDEEGLEELQMRWGVGYTWEDYSFLEKELSEWKKTHKSDTKAEEMLLIELCHLALQIRKQRSSGGETASMIKELQFLMKTASVDPAKTAIAGSGKSQDTFSSFIKTIEENEPAELFSEERDAFKDFQNIDYYFRKYVTRPLKNFLIQGSRDFNLDDNPDDDVIEEDDESNVLEILEGKENA